MTALAFPGGVVELDDLPVYSSGLTTLGSYPILIIGDAYVEESDMRIPFVVRDVEISWGARELTVEFHATERGWVVNGTADLWSGPPLTESEAEFLAKHLAAEAEAVP